MKSTLPHGSPPGSLSHDAYQQTRHFPALDGLRGLAVLAVVFYHCPALLLPGVEQAQRAGDAGVDIFFVLSGFLITMLLLRDRAAGDASMPQLLSRFFIKRVLRIFPLYYLAIVLYWIKVHVGFDPAAVASFEQSLAYLFTYTIDAALGWGDLDFPAFGIAWSLGVEEKFYLFWPFVVLLLRPREVLCAGIALIAAVILWRVWIMHSFSGDLTARMYYPFDLRMDGIMWGCVLACVLHDPALYGIASRAVRPMSTFVVSGALFCVAAVLLENDSFLRYLALPMSAAVVIGCAVTRLDQPVLRPLRSRPMRYMGRISYGIYVFHPLAISAITLAIGEQWLWQRLTCVIAATAVTIALAAASYRWFESPITRLRDRLKFVRLPSADAVDKTEARPAASPA